MSLGTSLFLIVLLGLTLYGLVQINKKKKWRLVGKILAVLVLINVIVGLAVWGWYAYKGRPQPISELGGVSLGMTPLEVTLALGKPTTTWLQNEIIPSRRYFYDNYDGSHRYSVKFSPSEETPPDVVQVICSNNPVDEIFGLGKYDSEDEVTKKLGTPSSQSIRVDGLAKMISYKKWNVAFEIRQGVISTVCVTSTGKVTYILEYDSEKIGI